MADLFKELNAIGFNEATVMPRFVGDKEFYTSCFKSFMEENDIPALETALNQNDSHEAFKHLHALKGVVGNLGLERMYADICVMVEKFRVGNSEGWEADYKKVKADYETLQALKF